MKILHQLLYYLAFGLWWIVSILPMPIHYLGAEILYLLVRYVMRYRRKRVRQNLAECFPELSEKQRLRIEKRFYLYFADQVVEAIKFFSISKTEMRYRMQFKGLERINQSAAEGKSMAIFLGHYCNWEWVSSLPLWLDTDKLRALQLYHPLENATMDRLMGYVRERMGSTNIPMAQSIRHIMKYRQEGKPVVVGFIADQAPIWESLNYWLPFFGKDTPVMTGGERIARKMGMDCYYLHIRRVRRGRYVAEFQLITDKVKETPEFYVTEQYYQRLEANIREQPSYWLWTHNRWKRSRQGLINHLRNENRWLELENLKFYDRQHPEGWHAGIRQDDPTTWQLKPTDDEQ